MLRSLLALALVMQAPATTRFDSNRAWEHLRQLVSLGPRPAGSAGIEQSRAYIRKQLAAAGVPRDAARASLDLFTREVMPAIVRRTSAAPQWPGK